MQQIKFSDRLRYRFDNIMSKGTIALIGWLALLSAALVLIVSGIVYISGLAPAPDGMPLTFGQTIWYSFMRTMDAGALGGDTGSPLFIVLMLVVTLGGIFILSILIGVLTSGIEAKLDELRKGRSLVVEKDHTVILGWSSQIFSIISELVLANENRPGACIAIMAE
jgi:hypothetical protein